jgi:signal transduction histidine kinase/PAS domain-containing protein
VRNDTENGQADRVRARDGVVGEPGASRDEALDLAAVFAALPAIVLVLAPDAPRYTMLAATDGRLAATLTTRAATLGRPLFEVFPDANPDNDAPSGVGNLRASLDTVLRTRAPHRMAVQRYDLQRPDGTWEERHWAPLNVPVLGPDGAVRYLVHRVEDVTEVVRLAAERDRLQGAVAGSERARASSDAARADLAAANVQLEDQALELELANQQLQDQAAELEAQADELRGAAAELEQRTETAEAARAGAEDARARTEAVLGSIADAFYLLDRDWRFTHVNAAAEPLLQTTADALVGRTLWEAFPDVAGSVFEGPYREAMATGRVTSAEAYFAPLGTWFDVRTYPWPGGLMVHFRDVGARRAAEAERERLLAELHSANAELRRMAASAQGAERRAQFLADLGQALQPLAEPDAVMEAAARLLGEHLGADRCAYAEVEADEDTFTITGNYTRSDTRSIVGRFTFRAFGAEVLRLMRAGAAYVVDDAAADPRVTPADRGAYEGTQIRAVVCVPLHKAGRFVAAMAVHQRAPRAWTSDEVELVVTVVQRCWEALERARALRRLQEREAALRATSSQLAERTAAAEAANRAKSDFLSTMSHELRTPLNAIQGYAELLIMGLRGPVTDAQRQDLERVRRANQHMAGLVTDVLNFARLEAGQVEYHPEAVPLGPLVRDLEALIGPQFAAKGLAYDHDGCGPETPERPHVVWADPEKVRQVLLNLLSNAVKFTDAAPGHPGRVSLACEADAAAGVVRVRVSDTGRGIAAAHLTRIFDPFVQVDRHHTQASQQGVGLGLAISRDLARGMGGDLTAESTLGAGSTFTLTLPRA